MIGITFMLMVITFHLLLTGLYLLTDKFKTKKVKKWVIGTAVFSALGYFIIGFYEPFYFGLSLIWVLTTILHYKTYKLRY